MESPLGDIIFLFGLAGTQGSNHMLMFSPLPTLQMQPLLKVWIPETILYQVKEDPFFGPAISISSLG
jgi:hypothetical protein